MATSRGGILKVTLFKKRLTEYKLNNLEHYFCIFKEIPRTRYTKIYQNIQIFLAGLTSLCKSLCIYVS